MSTEQRDVIDLTESVKVAGQKRLRTNRGVEMPSTLNAVYFKSSSGPQTRIFSNFYECPVQVVVDGTRYTFPSAEHAYSFLRHVYPATGTSEIHEWVVGGYYDDYLVLLDFMSSGDYSKAKVPTEKRFAKVNYWKKRKAIGIVAKCAVKQLKRLGTFTPRKTMREEWKLYWWNILMGKFANNEDLIQQLVATENAWLIEDGRRSMKNASPTTWDKSPWTGGIDGYTGRKYGRNWMGIFLMGIRCAFAPWLKPKKWKPQALP